MVPHISAANKDGGTAMVIISKNFKKISLGSQSPFTFPSSMKNPINTTPNKKTMKSILYLVNLNFTGLGKRIDLINCPLTVEKAVLITKA